MNKEEISEIADAIENMTHHLTTSLGEVAEVLAHIYNDVREINEQMK